MMRLIDTLVRIEWSSGLTGYIGIEKTSMNSGGSYATELFLLKKSRPVT